MNQITTNGNGLDPAIISSLVLNGDVGKLTSAQKLAYVAYRCKQVGLDPAAQPFQFLKLQGKEVLYATAGATQQLCQTRGLSVQITKREKVEDIFCVEARVTDKDGRFSENMGSTPIGGLKGEVLSNAMLKATTKAIRRTVLAHCGLGVLDELEAETIPGAVMSRSNPLRQEYQGFAYELDACKSKEQIDLILDSPEYQDFAKRCEDQHQRGGLNFADMLTDQADTKKVKLPERIEDKRKYVEPDRPSGMTVSNGGNDPVTPPPVRSANVQPAGAPDPLDIPPEFDRRPSPADTIMPEYSAEMDALFRMIDLAETMDDLTKASLAIATKGKELSAEDKAALTKAYKLRGRSLAKAAA